MASRKGQKRKMPRPKMAFAHCKLDGSVFSLGEIVLDGELFDYEDAESFIEALQSADQLVTWKASEWCRLLGINLDTTIDVWNCIAAESGFVPLPTQWVESKGKSMAEIICMLWDKHKSQKMLLYTPQNPARVPWESTRVWRGHLVPNASLVPKRPPGWLDDPCIPDI